MSETRIMIIGYSGSGKSTLAGKLGKRYNVEVLHLDCMHWLPGWKERTHEEMSQIVGEFLASHDNWVIDGNYNSTFYEQRLETSTQIIFMNFPRRICLYRVIKRYLQNRGRTRASMTEGCEEKIDWEFIWWVLHEGRNKDKWERFRQAIEQYGEKMVVLRKAKDVKLYLARVNENHI